MGACFEAWRGGASCGFQPARFRRPLLETGQTSGGQTTGGRATGTALGHFAALRPAGSRSSGQGPEHPVTQGGTQRGLPRRSGRRRRAGVVAQAVGRPGAPKPVLSQVFIFCWQKGSGRYARPQQDIRQAGWPRAGAPRGSTGTLGHMAAGIRAPLGVLASLQAGRGTRPPASAGGGARCARRAAPAARPRIASTFRGSRVEKAVGDEGGGASRDSVRSDSRRGGVVPPNSRQSTCPRPYQNAPAD